MLKKRYDKNKPCNITNRSSNNVKVRQVLDINILVRKKSLLLPQTKMKSISTGKFQFIDNAIPVFVQKNNAITKIN
jgi:hypothetical protein